MLRSIGIALSVGLLAAACNGGGDLKPVQEQQAGEYLVTLLSATGAVKNGTSEFFLEFRKAGGDQLVDVGTVSVSPIMEMGGMPPMMGSTTITPTDTPGRYRVDCMLSMAGMWKLTVTFGAGESARFNINAQ
jgi:hypothetical protein